MAEKKKAKAPVTPKDVASKAVGKLWSWMSENIDTEKIPEFVGLLKGAKGHPDEGRKDAVMNEPLGDLSTSFKTDPKTGKRSAVTIDQEGDKLPEGDLGQSDMEGMVVPYGSNTSEVPKNVPPKTLQEQHNLGRAGALNQILQLDPQDTNLHNFADSSEGRPIAEAILRNGPDDPNLASEANMAYQQFVAQAVKSPASLGVRG